MTTEERIAKLEQEMSALNNVLKKLTSRELALRSFAQAVFSQSSIDLDELNKAYLSYLDDAIAKVHPILQDQEALDALRLSLEEHMARRRRDQNKFP